MPPIHVNLSQLNQYKVPSYKPGQLVTYPPRWHRAKVVEVTKDKPTRLVLQTHTGERIKVLAEVCSPWVDQTAWNLQFGGN